MVQPKWGKCDVPLAAEPVGNGPSRARRVQVIRNEMKLRKLDTTCSGSFGSGSLLTRTLPRRGAAPARSRLSALGAAVALLAACGGDAKGGGAVEGQEPVLSEPAAAVEPEPVEVESAGSEPPATGQPAVVAVAPAPAAVEEEPEPVPESPGTSNGAFEADVEGPVGPTCDAVEKVFKVSCGSGGDCHVGVGIGDFALGEEQARALVGKPPTVNSPRCGLMVNPDRPFESMVLTKVTGDYPYESADCRTLMPPPFGGVTDAQIACLESWLWQFRR